MKIRIALIAIAFIAAVAAAWLWSRTSRAASIVAGNLPVVPELSEASPALRERITAADERALSMWSARSGLEELSRLYHANGWLAEALECYSALREIEPDEPRWPHLEATIISGYGRAEEAAILWERVLELAPDYNPARLRLGDIQLKSNQPDKAAATYREVLKRQPDEPYAMLGLARLDLEAGKLEDARTRLEAVVQKTSFNLGYDLIVALYERMGLRDRAEFIRGMAKASGAYRDPPDPWVDSLMTDCYDPYRIAITAGIIARDGQAAEAMKLLRRAIELSPNDVSARFQLGTLAVQQGDLATARTEFIRCTELSPGFADPWWHLSELLAKNGDPVGAERALAEGLRNNPESPGLHLLRARRLRDAGRTGAAIVEFEASIRYRPNEADAYMELGSYLVSLGREAEGMRQFRRAIEAEPGNPVALGILAFHAITTGDEAEARAWMTLVRDQPRVPKQQSDQLRSAYQQQFGRPAP